MTTGEKIKALRDEKDWSQDELGSKLDIDGRQISRYENGKFIPSADVLIKLAKVLNISIDYLLLDDAPRRPLNLNYENIVAKLQEIGKMTAEDEKSLLHFLSAIKAKNKLINLADAVKD